MTPDDITAVLTRLDRIESALQTILERHSVKDWYTTEEVARALGKAEFTVRSGAASAGCAARKRAAAGASTRPGSSATRSCSASRGRGCYRCNPGPESRTQPH